MTMTDDNHDTFTDLPAGTPAPFTMAARGLPVLLGLQFLLAGQALFGGMSWGTHAAVGGLVLLPVAILAGYALFVPRLRGFGWWAGVVLILYVVQVSLAISGMAALALHPLNAAFLLAASLVFLFKVERRRGRQHPID